LEVHDNMTDKEKIVQHGFDLKQSFRHRKWFARKSKKQLTNNSVCIILYLSPSDRR
jgi:predicted nucleotidyltransferase